MQLSMAVLGGAGMDAAKQGGTRWSRSRYS